ncbi:hypothetical protein [Ruegeria atlantica]|uniref:hypothetical protein n=1 Tax=Ruegeria atlantica TaxID=81569 RepID=UPI0014801700|nr:hypothetical protein [Ruegeria atlantica]
MNKFISLLFFLAFFGHTAPILAQGINTEIITSNSLTRLNYSVEDQGTVSIFLPAEIVPGDTVTSRIRVAAKDQKVFEGFTLRVEEVTHPVRDGLVEWRIPEETTSEFTVELIGASGDTAARISISLQTHPKEPKGTPGRDGSGIRILPIKPKSGSYSAIPNDFFDGIEVVAVSPRAVVIFDSLVLDTRPDPVLCCSEGGPCGLTSCCDFIPSRSCLHCNVSGYDECLLDTAPPTPNPNPN